MKNAIRKCDSAGYRPGAVLHGGEIVAQGTLRILYSEHSLTDILVKAVRKIEFQLNVNPIMPGKAIALRGHV